MLKLVTLVLIALVLALAVLMVLDPRP